ncbi:MAG: amidophosphoribosyltransferase [Coriobacteriia bacterium]|nr:amidophosphoribosyltransferase [Coriobacteriia bacterium]
MFDPSELMHNDDKLHDECGVFGIYAPGKDTSRLTYFGLHALQHRGQESAGIAVGDGCTVMVRKDLGLVQQVFADGDIAALKGNVALGHVRYGTSGAKGWEAAQPHLSTIGDEIIALAHNGTLVNSDALRRELINLGVPFLSNTDSEVATKLIGYFTQKSSHIREGIRKTMELLQGAYAMALINNTSLYAFRDPYGIRPLVIGKFPNDEGWIVASETCALDIVGAEFVRDVNPGEIVRMNDEGMVAEQALEPQAHSLCLFEHVYFARPDSYLEGDSVYEVRVRMGQELARESFIDADLVIGVPDSGVPSAIGFSHESKIPYGEGLLKNRYVGRTFIQPSQELRERGVRLKLNPIKTSIQGKRLIVVDDSIVRGTTSRQIVAMLREAGAKEVHMRIVSPEVRYPCFYGIDTETQDQLISANLPTEKIREHIGADSLAFLSIPGLKSCVSPGDYCDACFSGDYLVEIPEEFSRGKFLEGFSPNNLGKHKSFHESVQAAYASDKVPAHVLLREAELRKSKGI